MFHCRFLAEYIAVSPGSSVSEAVQLLAGPPLVRMVHTKEGAQVNCAVINYGSAKDRKKVIKAMADHVSKLVNEEWGHIVLICALSLVDDTTLLRKSLVPELQVCHPFLPCGLFSVFSTKHACAFLLYSCTAKLTDCIAL